MNSSEFTSRSLMFLSEIQKRPVDTEVLEKPAPTAWIMPSTAGSASRMSSSILFFTSMSS